MSRKELEGMENDELLRKLTGMDDVDSLLPVMNRRVVIDHLLKLEQGKLVKFEIWSEGYDDGDILNPPTLHGIWSGLTFVDACQSWVDTLPTLEQALFNKDELTFWGRRLYSGQTEAEVATTAQIR